jgi:hypothetical protein
MGSHLLGGLASLRNSEVMTELIVECDEGQFKEDLHESLLRFTNLKSLTLLGVCAAISYGFFTDYFKPELPLQSLVLGPGLTFVWFDLTRAFKSKPTSLKSIVFATKDDDYPGDWYQELGAEEDARKSFEIYKNGGVKVSGFDLSWFEMVADKRSLYTTDDEVDLDDEENEENERFQSQVRQHSNQVIEYSS